MPDFHERLARLSDAVAALPGGEDAALALLALAGEVDNYLKRHEEARYRRASDLFQKWSEFLNDSVQDAHRHGDERLVTERRKLARRIAADSRWTGGYADALALTTKEDEPQ